MNRRASRLAPLALALTLDEAPDAARQGVDKIRAYTSEELAKCTRELAGP